MGKETNVNPNSRLNCKASSINFAFERKDSGSTFVAREAGTNWIHCLHFLYTKGGRYTCCPEKAKFKVESDLRKPIIPYDGDSVILVDYTCLSLGCLT